MVNEYKEGMRGGGEGGREGGRGGEEEGGKRRRDWSSTFQESNDGLIGNTEVVRSFQDLLKHKECQT